MIENALAFIISLKSTVYTMFNGDDALVLMIFFGIFFLDIWKSSKVFVTM